MAHPLVAVLEDAAAGRFSPPDGTVEVMPPDPAGMHAVVELTGRAYVLTNRPADEVLARGADGFGGASAPALKLWLAGPEGNIGSHDAVLVARGTGSSTLPPARGVDDHPRVLRARAQRREVHVHGDRAGFVTLGRGLVGRREVSVELYADSIHSRGDGRRLVREALGLVPSGEAVFAQVAPGNAASLRAFLACGFLPVGAETLLQPQHD